MSKWTGLATAGLSVLIVGVAFSGCSSSNDSGSGGGGAKGGSGGTGASGGTGGSGTGATGGSGGTSTGGSAGSDAGCPAAPDPNSTTACDVCQDNDHAECVCATESAACDNDADCTAIFNCVYATDDAGPGPCQDLTAAGAACELACIALHPAGKDLYLAYDKCVYCTYCAAACDTGGYCNALDNPPDSGTSDAGDASDASDDATDASSD